MPNRNLIKISKKYLNYLGKPVETIDSIGLMYNSDKKDFNKIFEEKIKQFEVEKFLIQLNQKQDIDSIIYNTIEFLFTNISYEQYNFFLKATEQISTFFNHYEKITDKHWIYLIDSYIKNSENIPIDKKNKFLNLFSSEKIVNQYSCLLAICTKDEDFLNFIKKTNYSFSQEDFIYAHLFGLESEIPYNQKITISKEIDYLLLSSVANTSSDKFQHFLEKFVTSMQIINSFKEKLNSKYIEANLDISFFEKIMLSSNLEKSIEKLEKYSNYIQLQESVGIENKEKTHKINKI